MSGFTLWERAETRLFCNWFVIGWHCWRKGHEWIEQHPSRCVTIVSCSWCGQYRGARLKESATECRWWRP